VIRQAVIAASVSGFLACAINEHHVENIVIPARPDNEIVTCNSPFVNPDPKALKACGDDAHGKGHCYDVTKVPFTASELPPCDGGAPGEVCVPDSTLLANGAKVKSCTFFFNGQPGACVSMLMKDVFSNKDVLKQDACDPDERCLPCVDPRNNQDTKLCAPTGAHQNDCIGGTGQAPVECCHAMGECIAESAVPEEDRGFMIHDVCPATTVCAPTSQLDANPTRCNVLGMSGVCLDVCFAAQLKGMTSLTRAGCGLTEVCLPCALADTQAHGGEHLVGCD
jgi:hypothetical protein